MHLCPCTLADTGLHIQAVQQMWLRKLGVCSAKRTFPKQSVFQMVVLSQAQRVNGWGPTIQVMILREST